MVGTVGDLADAEIGMAFGELVAVNQDRFLAARARTPAEERLLAAGYVARVVVEGPVGCGYAGIVFLDPPLHFLEQRCLQSLRILHYGGRVGVFRLQMRADILWQN